MEGADLGLGRVERQLRRNASGFDFFQAVRLLERLRPGAGIGRFADPEREPVRFGANASMAFPVSEIESLEAGDATARPRMRVNFLGLVGPSGVLPHPYTLFVADRRRARDGAVGEFFDLFHHRMLSLFYRAWEKTRPAVGCEKGEDRLQDHLLDLAGLGTEAAQRALPLERDAVAYYAALLGLQPRGAAALEQLLADYFGVTVEVQQFVGGWYAVRDTDRCAVGGAPNESNRLGGAVVGDEIWDQQTRVRVRLGPLDRARFDEFLPSGSAYDALRRTLRFFGHDQLDFEVQLVLARDEVPGCVLGTEAKAQPLGWSTWLRSGSFARDADETILTL